jgi:hypothetical protein
MQPEERIIFVNPLLERLTIYEPRPGALMPQLCSRVMIHCSIDRRQPLVHLSKFLPINERIPSCSLEFPLKLGLCTTFVGEFLFRKINLMFDARHGALDAIDNPAKLDLEGLPYQLPGCTQSDRIKDAGRAVLVLALLEDVSGFGAELDDRLKDVDHGFLEDIIVWIQSGVPTETGQVVSNFLEHFGELVKVFAVLFRNLSSSTICIA